MNLKKLAKILELRDKIKSGISCIFKNGVYSKTLKEMGPVRGREFHAVFAGQNLDFSHEVFEG